MSRRRMQALHVGPDTLTAVQTGHGDLDPGQNDARTSPRLCLPEVTSDLQNINHHLPHITLTKKSTLGIVSLKGEAVSLAVKQKEFTVSGRN